MATKGRWLTSSSANGTLLAKVSLRESRSFRVVFVGENPGGGINLADATDKIVQHSGTQITVSQSRATFEQRLLSRALRLLLGGQTVHNLSLFRAVLGAVETVI